MSSPYTRPDADSLHAYRGLFWRKPVLAAVMTVMMLSLAGSMTFGFIGKFFVVATAVNAELWWLTAAVVLGSAIGLYYYLRMMISLYIRGFGISGPYGTIQLGDECRRYCGSALRDYRGRARYLAAAVYLTGFAVLSY